jgi:hypothetical protein
MLKSVRADLMHTRRMVAVAHLTASVAVAVVSRMSRCQMAVGSEPERVAAQLTVVIPTVTAAMRDTPVAVAAA